MTQNQRIILIIISIILFLITIYGPAKFMEFIGKLFTNSIAACLVYIAIRGE